MDSTELQTYELQLEQVQTALMAEPENDELRNLESELHNLISMTRELIEQQEAEANAAAEAAAAAYSGKGKRRSAEEAEAEEQGAEVWNEHITDADAAAAATSSKSQSSAPVAQSGPARQYAAGEEVQAKYAGDGRWYPARITSIGGSVHNRVYSIVFKGFNTTELLPASDLRPTKSHASSHSQGFQSNSSATSASPYTNAASSASYPTQPNGDPKTKALDLNAEKERKKRRVEKSKERHATKAVESQSKQQAWQKFAKKKGAIGGNSMFRTPDDPLAKVGVVGAGRGMTQTTNRSKHVFDSNSK
ncbi:hypothetical protein OC845_003064 [Tilletia horrida]|nr:hypothetical protein OC845_003064 [Tilletia horrida]